MIHTTSVWKKGLFFEQLYGPPCIMAALLPLQSYSLDHFEQVKLSKCNSTLLIYSIMTYYTDCNNDENSRRCLQKEKIQLSQIRQHPFDRKCDLSCGRCGAGGSWISYSNHRKVASCKTSCLEAHADSFRLLMKGIFNPYVLWPFNKKLIS